jgi:hypothetical protein
MILIAGPYRSGTGDDPARMADNLARLEEAAWPIFHAGHIPMIGEWVALPVLHSAGADGPLDPLAEQVMYPTAERLLEHCDAVLRLPGESTGADRDVAIARRRGIPVYVHVEEIPGYQAPSA